MHNLRGRNQCGHPTQFCITQGIAAQSRVKGDEQRECVSFLLFTLRGVGIHGIFEGRIKSNLAWTSCEWSDFGRGFMVRVVFRVINRRRHRTLSPHPLILSST